MKKIMRFKKILTYLELEGQGRGTIIRVTCLHTFPLSILVHSSLLGAIDL